MKAGQLQRLRQGFHQKEGGRAGLFRLEKLPFGFCQPLSRHLNQPLRFVLLAPFGENQPLRFDELAPIGENQPLGFAELAPVEGNQPLGFDERALVGGNQPLGFGLPP